MLGPTNAIRLPSCPPKPHRPLILRRAVLVKTRGADCSRFSTELGMGRQCIEASPLRNSAVKEAERERDTRGGWKDMWSCLGYSCFPDRSDHSHLYADGGQEGMRPPAQGVCSTLQRLPQLRTARTAPGQMAEATLRLQCTIAVMVGKFSADGIFLNQITS